MQTIVFRSKIDGLIYGVFAVIFFTGALPVVVSLVGGRTNWVVSLIILVVAVALPVWLVTTTRYELGAAQLTVISGPLRYRVPLNAVRDIRPTDNAMASPALSLDRLRIEYGLNKSIMISPRDKELFLREFAERRARASQP